MPELRYNVCDFDDFLPEEPEPQNSNGRGFTVGETIKEGQRNDTLYRMGRSLRDKGLSEAAGVAALLTENKEKCDPPLDEQEVRRIAAHAFEQLDRPDFERNGRNGASGGSGGTTGFELRPLDLTRLDEVSPAPSWAIEGRIAVGDIVLLSGDSGSYKTWFGLQLAIDLSCERSIFGQFSHPGSEFGRIMVIDEENHGDLLRRRLARLTRGADLSEERLTQVCDRVRIFAGSGFRLDDECAYQALRRELVRFRPAFLILDSLVRLHTSDENSAGEMSRLYLTRLAPLRREFDLTIIVLHHTRKHRKDDSSEPGQMLRGSGDLRAMCDSHLQLRKTGPGTVSVIADKCRHGEEASPFILEVVETDNGGTTVRYAGEPEQRVGSRDAVKMRIVAFLGREIEAELAGIIEAIGRDRKAVTRALEALQSEGVVERPSRGRYRLVQESA